MRKPKALLIEMVAAFCGGLYAGITHCALYVLGSSNFMNAIVFANHNDPMGLVNGIIACAKACLMDVDPVRCQDHTECIRCGACIAACPAGALKLTFAGKVPLIKGSDVVPDAAEKSL